MDIKDRDKLVEAFEHMIENVADAMHEAEEALAPSVDEMVRNAQELTRDLFALTQEEAETLGNTLKRDMHKANDVLNRQGKELKDWWSFDMALMEDRFADMIARAADKTWLDFHAFESAAPEASLYRSGEVCSAGTFSCARCGHEMHLSKTGHIPPCANCHHGEFFRVVG